MHLPRHETKVTGDVRFYVLTVVTVNITVLWEVTPCCLADRYQSSRRHTSENRNARQYSATFIDTAKHKGQGEWRRSVSQRQIQPKDELISTSQTRAVWLRRFLKGALMSAFNTHTMNSGIPEGHHEISQTSEGNIYIYIYIYICK